MSERREYLVATPFFPSPTDWRGAYCYDFVRALERNLAESGRPWRVHVFTEGDGSEYEIDGIKVRTFRAKRLPSIAFPQFFARRNGKTFLDAVARAGIEFKDIAVCHAHTAIFAIYALAVKDANPGCMTLLHHHSLQCFGLNKGVLRWCWPYNAILYPWLRRLHERIDRHVFISGLSRKSLEAAPDASWAKYEPYRRLMRGFGFFRPARLKATMVLHNGVDKTLFRKLDVKKRDAVFTIGCVANFVPLKDQMTLLMAVVELGNGEWGTGNGEVKVIFVGSGKERAKCEEYARENGIDAEFREEVRHEELPAFYNSLDLFVLPSAFEGFGCVYTEAHSCGVPFIACKGQGIDEIIPEEDKSKWLANVHDPEDLAARIKGYMENRWEQRLTENQDIDFLVGRFTRELGIV